VRLVYICPPGRLRRLHRAQAGQLPTEFFFGGIEIERSGSFVQYEEIDIIGWPRLRPHLIDAYACRVFSTDLAGRSFRGAAKLVKRLPPADCIIVTEEALAFGMALLAVLRRVQTPIVCIRCRLSTFDCTSSVPRFLSSSLLRATHTILISGAEAETLPKRFSLQEDHYSYNSFGVDARFWRPAERTRKFVLAIGDSFRDYGTLLRAAKDIRSQLLIVTAQELSHPLPNNVSTRRGCWRNEILLDEELRELYQAAICVVVPLEDRPEPTGQSVCLQAMSCGRPVIMTRTRGLWSSHLRDGENLFMVNPGDSVDLAAKVNRLVDDPCLAAKLGHAARESVYRHFRIVDFANRLEALCHRLACRQATKDGRAHGH
jgi:glycosyltransferase involved in cell wall biosynthesis